MSAEALAVKLAELSFTWKGSQQALDVPSEPMVACNSSSSVWKRVEAKQRAARAAAKQSREAASGCTSAGYGLATCKGSKASLASARERSHAKRNRVPNSTSSQKD